MANILIQAPENGLNSQLTATQIDPREAAEGSKNVIYRNGKIETDYGFQKLGLTTTGLDSGKPVLSLFPFRELDKYEHLMATTTTKIMEYNNSNVQWVDRTQSGKAFNSDLYNPISFVEIAHNSDIHLDDDSAKDNAYYHLVVCNGGLGDIQRWAGRYETDFADLVGAGGYHDGTTHRALQVGSLQNRLLLISPNTYSSTDKVWSENSQRIQYPIIGKLETWTGTGSGFIDLLDTGGKNVWSAPMGGQYIIYQDKGIWTINPVGGTKVFSPIPYFPNFGLLGSKLIYNRNNVHYFVGTDYNIYAYYGGTTIENIGTKIQKYFEADITKQYPYRCRITMDKNNEFLWIWIVKDGDETITKAYGMNTKTGAWMIRDLSDKFSSDNGITTVSLVGSQTFELGESYRQAMETIGLYSSGDGTIETGDNTVTYGEKLLDSSRALTYNDISKYGTSWCDGGLEFYSSCADCSYMTDFTKNDIIMTSDGSKFVTADGSYKIPFGTHFYTLYDVTHNHGWIAPHESSAAICISHQMNPDASTQFTVWQPVGETYNDVLSVRKSDEAIHIGDSTGFVYYFDSEFASYSGTDIDSCHYTPEIDLQMPDTVKKWDGITVTAKGSYLGVSYKIDDISWVDMTVKDLTTMWKPYNWYINRSGKKIQFKFSNKKRLVCPVFNGTTGYIEVSDNNALDVGTGDFTISFWIKPSTVSVGQGIVKKYTGEDVIGYDVFLDQSGYIYVLINDGTENFADLTVKVPNDTWSHVLISFDRDNTVNVYLNGVLGFIHDISAVSLTLNNSYKFIIGLLDEIAFDGFLSGSLDDLRIYKKVLTQAEILTIYNSGIPKAYSVLDTPTSGAAAVAFNMNEGTGRTITDEIGGLVGTFAGGVTWNTDEVSEIKEFQIMSPIIESDR